MPDGYLLTEDDIKLLAELLRQSGQTVRGFTQRRPRHHVEDGKASDVYVARTPADGIPALTPGLLTGTGTTAALLGTPGFADCAVYRVVEGGCTGTNASCGPGIESIDGVERTVYNLTDADVPGDAWVVIVKDKGGQWHVVGGGAAPLTALVATFAVADQATFVACTGLTTTGSTCPPVFYVGTLQTYDEDCQQWVDGDCCVAFDVEGRGLEIGRRYFPASRVGATVAALTAQAAPVGAACATLTAGTPLYAVDVGELVRTVLVQEEFGRLCSSTGTATAGSTETSTSGESPNLVLYRGQCQQWDPYTCVWVGIEDDVMVADVHGCDLEIGRHYEGYWSQMLPDTLLDSVTGTGTTSPEIGCTPLYLVDTPKRSGVADVRCEAGVLHVYAYHDCDTIVYSHSAGCCECSGDTTPTGTGTGHGAACCSHALSNTLFATVPGVGSVTLTRGSGYWLGDVGLACGLHLYLRFSESGSPGSDICSLLEYSCDQASWTPLGSAIGTADACNDPGGPFQSRPFDGVVFNSAAGCADPNTCTPINGIVVSE